MESIKNEVVQHVVQSPKTLHLMTASSASAGVLSQWMQINYGWLFAMIGMIISIFLAVYQIRSAKVIRERERAEKSRAEAEAEYWRAKKAREDRERMKREDQGLELRRSTDH